MKTTLLSGSAGGTLKNVLLDIFKRIRHDTFQKFTLLIATSSILTACTNSPPNHQATISYPQTSRSGAKYSAYVHDNRKIQWWKRMHDPELNHLIDKALQNNTQIKAAKANINQAQEKLKASHFAWVPTLDLNSNSFIGGTWDKALSPRGILASSPALRNMGNMHFRGYFNGFMPSYSLNILQNINADKLASASLRLQEAEYQSTQLSIISQVSGAYFMLIGHRAQAEVQHQLLRDLKHIKKLEQVRYHDGATDLTSIAQLDKQIANTEANLEITKNSIAEVENAIQVLLNQNPGTIITHQSINKLTIEGLIPKQLSSNVLKCRPDILIAEENLNIALANLGIAYAQFFPSISLTNIVGGVSLDLTRLLKMNTGVWIAQAAASMPILNGAAYAGINASKAGAHAAYLNYIHTLKSVFADVDNSLTNQQKMNQNYHYQLKAQEATKTAYHLALAKYHAGAKDYREVINAKINLDYAKLDAILAKMQQLDSIVELYQALAGGSLPLN